MAHSQQGLLAVACHLEAPLGLRAVDPIPLLVGHLQAAWFNKCLKKQKMETAYLLSSEPQN